MRSSAITVVVLAMLVAGCSQTRVVNTDDPASIAASRVNRIASNRLAQVELVDGHKFYVLNAEIGPERSIWQHPTSGEFVEVPTSRLDRVTVVRAGQGALFGLGTGIILGGAFGLVRAVVEGDDPPNEFPRMMGDRKLVVFPPAHALYASLGTTAIGAAVGRKLHFRFAHEAQEPPPQIVDR